VLNYVLTALNEQLFIELIDWFTWHELVKGGGWDDVHV
jgi:hypothetical protein